MDEIVTIWKSGGWVMASLFALSLLLYSHAFQLLLYVMRMGLANSDESRWREWVRDPRAAEGRVKQIIEFTQGGARDAEAIRNRFREVRLSLVSSIDRRSLFIGTLVAAAPLMGLLGTVLGMLQTFLGISSSGGTETTDIVAAGISEALVTTEAGLMIALPGLFLIMIIQLKTHQIEARIARLESVTLGSLTA